MKKKAARRLTKAHLDVLATVQRIREKRIADAIGAPDPERGGPAILKHVAALKARIQNAKRLLVAIDALYPVSTEQVRAALDGSDG